MNRFLLPLFVLSLGLYAKGDISSNPRDALFWLKKIDSSKKKQSNKNKPVIDVMKCFVLAKFGDYYITNIDIINVINYIAFSSGKTLTKQEAQILVPYILRGLINNRIILNYARLSGSMIGDKEVDEQIKEIASNNSMSVDDFLDNLEKSGVNIKIFRNSVKSKMAFQYVVDMERASTEVSQAVIKETIQKKKEEQQTERYCLRTIFFKVCGRSNKKEVRQQAELIHGLLKKGINFFVLEEAISQDIFATVDNDRWVGLEGMEAPVANAISNLKCGEFSDVIETKNGFAIIYLKDKAAPRKEGCKKAVFYIFQATMKKEGLLMTSNDIKKINEKLEAVSKAKSIDEFKKTCKKFKIDFVEKKITNPDEHERQAIETSKASKTPVFYQSLEDKSNIEIVLYKDDYIPDAKLPSDSEIKKEAGNQTAQRNLHRQLEKVSSITYQEIDDKKMAQVCQ